MGMIDTVRNRIKSVFSRERTNIERATDLSVGAQPVGFDTASIYGRYGIEPLVDYLRIEQELVSRYMDYNEMCVYPELSAALECYADESCQFDILTGRTVWVESDDAFVKHVLQELIDKGLQLDEEIWGLSHELCKYGNCFSELLCTGEGVIGLNALPPETIRRYEKGKGILVGYAQDPRGVFGVTVEDVEKALSGHDPTASGMAYFEPWQILNMRLMGLQRQAPYGHCVAGDTKVWCNPAVKNIVDVKSKDRVYMRHSGQLRSSEVIDRVSNGKKAIYKLKTVHREIRATENHEFLVYLGEKNNRWKQLKDINVGDKIIIATTMPGIGRPPTLGIRYDKLTDDSSVRLTRRGLRAVQMSRGSQKYGQKHDGVLTATRDTGIPEHLLKAFMTGDATVTFKQFKEIFGKIGLEVFEGSYKIYRGERTTKLNLPDFVTPWFCRLWGFMLGDGWIRGNQVVFARGVYPKLNRYYARLFEKIGLKVRLTQNKEQAYVDSQDLVNLLQDLGWKNGAHEKRVPNWIYGLPKKYREEFVAGFMDADGWDSDSDGTKAFHTELCNRELVRGLKTIIDGLGYKCGNIRKREGRSDSSIKGRRVHSGNTFTITFYKSKLEQPFDYDIVKSKEFDGVEEVYDIGVEDPEHNFIADGIVAHNSILESARWLWRRLLLLEDSALLYRLTRSPQKWLFYIDVGKLPPNQALGYLRRIKNEFTKSKFVNERGSLDMRYSPLASDENLFLPVVDGKRTTEVELMATPEWQVMDDINYFRDKLFTAIRIPKAYLAAEEVSRSRTLSLEDVRFARSIMRIQRELKNGIKRLCKVHLAAMNVDPEKVNFEVFMTVPSWAYEMAQIEVRSARADFAEKVGDHLSERAILRLVFGFSDEEINALRKERKEEMREAAEAEGGGAEPEKKAPAKTEGSIMDLPRLSRVAAKDEEKEDKNMRILKEKMDEMLGQNKGIAESLDQSKDFMKNLKTSIMFQPYRGQQRVVKSLGMGPRRNA